MSEDSVADLRISPSLLEGLCLDSWVDPERFDLGPLTHPFLEDNMEEDLFAAAAELPNVDTNVTVPPPEVLVENQAIAGLVAWDEGDREVLEGMQNTIAPAVQTLPGNIVPPVTNNSVRVAPIQVAFNFSGCSVNIAYNT